MVASEKWPDSGCILKVKPIYELRGWVWDIKERVKSEATSGDLSNEKDGAARNEGGEVREDVLEKKGRCSLLERLSCQLATHVEMSDR